jgi:hypothetical protein
MADPSQSVIRASGAETCRGERATAPIENICCEKNPRLQLQGDDTSDGAVFSLQHLLCFIRRMQFCTSHSDALGASL